MKQKIISRIVAIWIMACMLLAGTTTVYAAYITIGVDLVRQAKTQWCWAACLEMNSHYLGYTTYDQWDIVQNVKGTSSNPYPNEPGDASDYKEGMEFATNSDYTATRSSGTISISSMKSYMNNHVPLIIALGTYSNGSRKSGHAVVVYSVDSDNNRFKVRNPASDYETTYNYSTITDSSRTQYWDATIKIS